MTSATSKGLTAQNGVCAITAIDFIESDTTHTTTLTSNQPWKVRVSYRLEKPLETGISLRISSGKGVKVADIHEFIGRGPVRMAGEYVTEFDLGRLPLAPGQYFLSVYAMVHHGPSHLIVDPAVSFDVLGTLKSGEETVRTFDVEGVLLLTPSITTEPAGQRAWS